MTSLRLQLPGWLANRLTADLGITYPTVEERMSLVLALCAEQVAKGTGGPFSAAVFEADSGRLVSVGVNLVETEQCSLLHAEMVALMLAQQALGGWNLADGEVAHELVSSAAPCAMCLGAIPWAGVGSLVCAARDEDVRAIGFDEGCKPQPWTKGLAEVGVRVQEDVQRDAAADILRSYQSQGGAIYNA